MCVRVNGACVCKQCMHVDSGGASTRTFNRRSSFLRNSVIVAHAPVAECIYIYMYLVNSTVSCTLYPYTIFQQVSWNFSPSANKKTPYTTDLNITSVSTPFSACVRIEKLSRSRLLCTSISFQEIQVGYWCNRMSFSPGETLIEQIDTHAAVLSPPELSPRVMEVIKSLDR